jgi:hypothetical protein
MAGRVYRGQVKYTFVSADRQNELTRRIQQKLAKACTKLTGQSPNSPPDYAHDLKLETALSASAVAQ